MEPIRKSTISSGKSPPQDGPTCREKGICTERKTIEHFISCNGFIWQKSKFKMSISNCLFNFIQG